MPRPVCFMVMPYGRKATQAEAGKGPSEIDFNALWDLAYVPVIKKLGYEPVRADQDVGALIVTEMLERLYFADLVLSDMTIANGNVYYEVGIRHAAQKKGCVLLAADWSKPLFDVAQLRTVRYPLPEGNIGSETATAIRNAIAEPIAAMARGSSPMHNAVPGYPDHVDPSTAATMQEFLRELAELQGSIRAIRVLPLSQRMPQAKVLVDTYGSPSIRAPVAIALVRVLLESASKPEDWSAILDFIAALPRDLADEAEFLEKRAFALSNAGQHSASIAQLETLIERFGPTPERLGLLGGRFKRLTNAATSEAERERLRDQAIEAYERGMNMDLNEYYCSSNLPRLYRDRKAKGDEQRAHLVLCQVMIACERGIARGVSDEWLRSTLLTAAFDSGDAEKAEELARRIDVTGAAPYKLVSIIQDLEQSAEQVSDPGRQTRLRDVVRRLQASLDDGGGSRTAKARLKFKNACYFFASGCVTFELRLDWYKK